MLPNSYELTQLFKMAFLKIQKTEILLLLTKWPKIIIAGPAVDFEPDFFAEWKQRNWNSKNGRPKLISQQMKKVSFWNGTYI